MDVALMDKLEDILSSCEYNGEGINSLLNRGSIKSVQRGTLKKQYTQNNKTQAVTISPVDVSKTLAFADCLNENDEVSAEAKAVVMDIRENEVDIKFRAVGNYAYPESVYARINWTVIEFY